MEEVGWTSLKRWPSLDEEQTARAVLNGDSRECRLRSTSLLAFFSSAIFRLRDGTKWLIKPQKKKNMAPCLRGWRSDAVAL